MESPHGKNSSERAFCECKRPSSGKDRRNLVVCIDGTSNKFGLKNTNVVELYSQLTKDDTQLTYYNSGIGTHAKPSWRSFNYFKQVVYSKIDLAIAWNFEKIVMSAYRWLADNYRDGDRIFLFGFSRGAYQVRTIAGMIDKVGLIYKGNEEQIPFAYELYADHTSGGTTSTSSNFVFKSTRGDSETFTKLNTEQKEEEPGSLSERFKKTFSRNDVRVHFTGVWDTVSSIGMVRDKNLPGTISPHHTCFFRHALALDERRVKFLPEYACGGIMKSQDDPEQLRENTDRHVKEVWFPGTHSDIGGGNAINKDLDRRHPAFLWMTYEATSAGLKLSPTDVEWKWDELGRVHESLTLGWKLFEYLPFKRLSYKDARSHTWYPHLGQGRNIQPGQTVHASVAFCKEYFPKALLPRNSDSLMDWKSLVGSGTRYDVAWTKGRQHLLEMDIFDLSMAELVVNEIEVTINPDPVMWVHRLTVMTYSHEGRETMQRVDGAARRLIMATPNLVFNAQVAVASAVALLCDDFGSILFAALDSSKLQWNGGEKTFFRAVLCDVMDKKDDKALESMIRNDNLRRKMFDADIIMMLLSNLEDEDEFVRQSAAYSIGALAKHDDSRRKMLDPGFIATLLSDLESKDAFVYRPAIGFIQGFVKYDDSRRQMLESDVVPILLQKLGEEKVRESAFDIIRTFAKYDNSRSKILDPAFMTTLLSKFASKDVFVRESAIDSIKALAKYDDSRRKMLEFNSITTLLSKLGDADAGIWRSTVDFIGELATYGDLRLKMLDSDIMAFLLSKLDDNDPEVRESAFDIIRTFAKYEGCRRNMLDSAFITILLSKLESQVTSVRQSTVDCIRALTKYSDLRHKVVDSNGIMILLSMLEDNDSNVCRSAINFISELATHVDSHRKMLDSNFITMLLSKLESKDILVCRFTNDFVWKFAKHDDSRRKMLDFNVLTILLSKLEDNDQIVLKSAMTFIEELAKHDDSRRKMWESNFIASLLSKLEDKCPSFVRRSAIDTIGQLAGYDDLRCGMLDSNVFTIFLSKLEDKDWDVRESAVKFIRKLAKYDDSRSKILDSDLLAALLSKLGDNDPDVCRSAVECIRTLARHADSRRKMLDSNFIMLLLSKFESKDVSVGNLNYAVDTVRELANHDDLRQTMLDFNVVAILGGMRDTGQVHGPRDDSRILQVIDTLEGRGCYSE